MHITDPFIELCRLKKVEYAQIVDNLSAIIEAFERAKELDFTKLSQEVMTEAMKKGASAKRSRSQKESWRRRREAEAKMQEEGEENSHHT